MMVALPVSVPVRPTSDVVVPSSSSSGGPLPATSLVPLTKTKRMYSGSGQTVKTVESSTAFDDDDEEDGDDSDEHDNDDDDMHDDDMHDDMHDVLREHCHDSSDHGIAAANGVIQASRQPLFAVSTSTTTTTTTIDMDRHVACKRKDNHDDDTELPLPTHETATTITTQPSLILSASPQVLEPAAVENEDSRQQQQQQQQRIRCGVVESGVPIVLIQRPSSIIKPYKPEDIPISNRGGVWKQLPKPDMCLVHRALSSPLAVRTDIATSAAIPAAATPVSGSVRTGHCIHRKKTVSFDRIVIREYDQTVGDNPSVSYGPPISLDWTYQELDPVDFEDYEDGRGPRRSMRQMMLNYYTRMHLLTWRMGISENDIATAERDVNKTKLGRSLTRALLPIMIVEDACQSMSRKCRRMSCRSNDNITVVQNYNDATATATAVQPPATTTTTTPITPAATSR